MIFRQNYTDAKFYIDYLDRVMQLEKSSILNIWGYMRHLLEWADDTPFTKAKDIKIPFPTYLLSARNSGTQGKQLAPTTMKKTCEYARRFFDYCRQEWPGRYRTVPLNWIDTIRPPRARGMQSQIKQHQYYSIESMLKIASCDCESVREERDRAALCFLFLSGMRSDAFITMPVKAVDLDSGRVRQLPELGMRTKNNKAAVTTILHIPELLRAVNVWHERIKDIPGDSLWFAQMSGDGETIIPQKTAGKSRRALLSKGLKKICSKAGVEYLSLHKFRHGHVVYALQRVKDMAGLKAVSQNVMHSSVGITDSIYGNLIEDDVHNVISNIGSGKQKETHDLDNLTSLLAKLLENPTILNDLKKQQNNDVEK